MKREAARLVGFTAGYLVVVLLERALRRIAAADAELAAADLAAADELARRRAGRRCNCTRCEAVGGTA